MNQYFKNFILCGEIDFYCLICQESFNITKDVDKHIRWEKHRKEIKSLQYVPKFKKDSIYKIKDQFYCEICNFTTKDPACHIADENHNNKKQHKDEIHPKQSFVKFENSVISVNNINITKLQWHGVFKKTCSVCADTVEQANTHILSFNHMVNLIQSIIKCKDNKCYRELPKNIFYCFTCYKTYDMKLLTSHLNNKCNEETKGNSDNKSYNDDNNNSMVNILAKVYKDSFSVDITKKTALCLKCNETIAAASNAMSKHKSDHMEESGEVYLGWYYDHGKKRSELAKYGKENYIHLNERGCKGYCSLCDIFLSAHMNIATQHVHGALHRGFLELKGLVQDQKHAKIPCRMVPHKTFVDDMFGPFKIGESTVVVCINDGICVDLLSYMLIKVINDFKGPKSKCFACDIKFNSKDMLHFKSKEHLNILYACKVLIIERDGDKEFIREIRPGLYHCGFCNKVLAFWENINKHLKTFPHKVQKQKKKLLSIISAKMLLNPLCPVELIEEYHTLRSLDCF